MTEARSNERGLVKLLVNVELPGKQVVTISTDLKSRLENIFNQACLLVGISEREYFGLAVLHEDGDFRFVDHDQKLHRVLTRTTLKRIRAKALQPNEIAATLYLRVQFYVETPGVFQENTTTSLYYHQLRENVLDYGQVYTEDVAYSLAALAMQADLGSYTGKTDRGRYFDPAAYLPSWLLKLHGSVYVEAELPRIHMDLQRYSREKAQMYYISTAQQRPYHHNIHLHGLKRKKQDTYHNIYMGIGFTGIEIFEDVDGIFKKHISTFSWPDISKLHCDKKHFEIRIGDRKFSYYCDTEERSAYFLRLCRLTHTFVIGISQRIAKLQPMANRTMHTLPRRLTNRHRHQTNTLPSSTKKSQAPRPPGGVDIPAPAPVVKTLSSDDIRIEERRPSITSTELDYPDISLNEIDESIEPVAEEEQAASPEPSSPAIQSHQPRIMTPISLTLDDSSSDEELNLQPVANGHAFSFTDTRSSGASSIDDLPSPPIDLPSPPLDLPSSRLSGPTVKCASTENLANPLDWQQKLSTRNLSLDSGIRPDTDTTAAIIRAIASESQLPDREPSPQRPQRPSLYSTETTELFRSAANNGFGDYPLNGGYPGNGAATFASPAGPWRMAQIHKAALAEIY